MAEPGITQTDILKLNKPDKGYFNWDVPLNENWDKLDVLGASQLPLLSLLEIRHKLSGADLIGWSLQGSVLDGDVYKGVWSLVYAAKQRASTTLSKQIRGVTYYYSQDSVTGLVFVDNENYNKALQNLGDSLGYVCTYVDGVKTIRLPQDRSFNGPILESDGVPGEFEDESLPNIKGTLDLGSANNTLRTANGAYTSSGAISVIKGSGNNGANSSGYGLQGFTFDASRSSSTYQDNAPVKPRTHKTYRYYKVGNTVINSTQIDMGNVLEQLGNLGIQINALEQNDAIVESQVYDNGSWFMKFKNGLLFQGGLRVGQGNVNMARPFANTKYVGFAITQATGGPGGIEGSPRFGPVSTTVAYVAGGSGGNAVVNWGAFGKGA